MTRALATTRPSPGWRARSARSPAAWAPASRATRPCARPRTAIGRGAGGSARAGGRRAPERESAAGPARHSGGFQAVAATLGGMTTSLTAAAPPSRARQMLNKVPEVTAYFWIIKIMCTTVGETAADYLNVNLGFGLTNTTYFAGALLAALLVAQFRLRRYVPGIYWALVVVISVFGTLITDNMTDRYNVPLTTSTPIFAVVLATVFAVWFAVERTLSIHTIFTTRREAFYWLAILFTFALGTAAGDLVAEQYSLGYGPSIALWGTAIAVIAVAYYRLRLDAVLAFWAAYVLTRPLGASIGDFMSQHSKKYGGLGLGTTGTSYIFLGCILALV